MTISYHAASMSFKICDVVSKFSGSHGEDVQQWLDKFQVAFDIVFDDMSEAERKKKVSSSIPLFLEGAAFSTWKQMDVSEQKDFDKVSAALRRVFGKSKMQAWRELKQIKYCHGDSIDVLTEEIKSLLEIVSSGDPVPQEFVALTLVDALPEKVAETVRLHEGETMQLQAVLSAAKAALTGSQGHVSQFVNVAVDKSKIDNANTNFKNNYVKPVNYFPSKKFSQNPNSRNTNSLTCYSCGKRGHIAKYCHCARPSEQPENE